MTQDELDRLVLSLMRVSDRSVDDLPISGSQRVLLEEIIATPVVLTDAESSESSRYPRRRPRRALLAAVTAVAAASVAVVWVPTIGGEDTAFAAAAVAVAEANPRLLLDAPGWTVDRVDSFTVVTGEMTFSDGNRRLDVHWRSADSYESYLADRGYQNEPSDLEVLGQSADLFQYGDGTDYTAILPPQGANFLEIRGDLGSLSAYQEIVQALYPVDVDTWLGAMPDSVVQPRDLTDTVTEMLVGLPVPDGFDPAPLLENEEVTEYYQVGARVSGAVACSWFSQWSQATAAGDSTAAQEAVDALSSATTWPVLLQMNVEGDYPEVVWELADQMAAGTLSKDLIGPGLGCDVPPLDAYLD